jgi:calmodulin
MSKSPTKTDQKNQKKSPNNAKKKSSTPDIPEEKLEEYRDAFNIFDKDNSGDISVAELSGLFKTLGHMVTDKEVKELLDSVDTNRDGVVSFDEFVVLMLKLETQEDSEEEEVIKAFKVFDRDGNGFLSIEEFKYILMTLGDKFSEQQVEEIFNETDLDGDGQIDYMEFINFWNSKSI